MYTKRKEDKMKTVKNICLSLKRYSFLLEQLISRDFKVKYKRSVLGVLWSLLNPILMMCVMAIVFTNVFKFSTPGVNYLTYLLTGLDFLIILMRQATFRWVRSLQTFHWLIRSIFQNIFSRYQSVYLWGLISCWHWFLCMRWSSWQERGWIFYHFLLPLSFIFLFVFTLGVSLFLATVSVFLRDMFYIYGIIIQILSYMTPIMYDINMLDPRLQMVLKLNPLYHIITFARTIILYHQIPTSMDFAACIISSIASLIIGAVVFRKNQDKFIYYV